MYGSKIRRAALPVVLALVGLVGARGAAAQRGQVTIPADTVVRATLDTSLNSSTATVGQRFTATVSPDDRSGFPDGTRLEGVVTDVKQHTRTQPGILDVEFRRVILPDDQRMTIDGQLASLESDDVLRTTEGRLESRNRNKNKLDMKWIGYGAAGGAILGTIFGGSSDLLKGGLLGALGGAAYGYLNRDKQATYREVELARATEFGVRLDQRVAFNDRSNYRYAGRYASDRTTDRYSDRPYDRSSDRTYDRSTDRYSDRSTDRYRDRDLDRNRDYDRNRDNDRNSDRYTQDRVAGDRSEYRYTDMTVRLNGRPVDFYSARPMRLNGEVFVPLAPIARAANMRYDFSRSDQRFTLETGDTTVEGSVGDTQVTRNGSRRLTLNAAPMLVNGQVYVNTEFLRRVADLQVNADDRSRLDLETYW